MYDDINFKGARSFCREIASIFISMMNRINNITLLNTPVRTRLITRGFCIGRDVANIRSNGGFLKVEKKLQNDPLFTYRSPLSSLPSLLFLNLLVSNIRKVLRAEAR